MDDYSDLDDAVDKAIREALAAYDVAAARFIEKVDNGEARSTRTYNDLKACMVKSKKARTMFGLRG